MEKKQMSARINCRSSAAAEDTRSDRDNYSHVQFIFSFILMPGKDGGGGK